MSQPQPYGQQATNPSDTGSFGWTVLGFFVPLIGLILWLVWRQDKPNNSRRSRNGFIAGLIVNVVVGVIYAIVIASALS
ncbi:MAG: PLDc N-terminal domain-containing protein [Propionibacteriaceae bacterium]|nr:PLDc N-terminal domain-containing protein [Propionibacteriaceae bacterium]